MSYSETLFMKMMEPYDLQMSMYAQNIPSEPVFPGYTEAEIITMGLSTKIHEACEELERGWEKDR
jgi:hypothetical protein